MHDTTNNSMREQRLPETGTGCYRAFLVILLSAR
jgi:hypothetical protein